MSRHLGLSHVAPAEADSVRTAHVGHMPHLQPALVTAGPWCELSSECTNQSQGVCVRDECAAWGGYLKNSYMRLSSIDRQDAGWLATWLLLRPTQRQRLCFHILQYHSLFPFRLRFCPHCGSRAAVMLLTALIPLEGFHMVPVDLSVPLRLRLPYRTSSI